METDATLRLIIAPHADGRSLLDVVAGALGGNTAAAALLIAHGGSWIDGSRVSDAATRVRAGAALALHRPPAGVYPQITVTAEQILYEDDDLLALNKPAGTYVGATPWDTQGNLLAALGSFLVARVGAAPPLHLAHRLDRDTSGVLLFSRNPAANRALQAAFTGAQPSGTTPSAGDRAHKEYLGLCLGEPAEDRFELETGHGRERHGRFRVYPSEEIGRLLPGGSRVKVMRTRFQVERRLGDAALVRAFLSTGRTHQIRLHLAHLGHPLLGDLKYGGPATWRDRPIPYHLLHALRLELPHPRTGAWLTLVAPAPAWADL